VTTVRVYRAPNPVVLTDPDGAPAVFNPSDLLPEDHWAVRSHPGCFEDVEAAVRKLYPAETETVGRRARL
jgi:hypothetical protein